MIGLPFASLPVSVKFADSGSARFWDKEENLKFSPCLMEFDPMRE